MPQIRELPAAEVTQAVMPAVIRKTDLRSRLHRDHAVLLLVLQACTFTIEAAATDYFVDPGDDLQSIINEVEAEDRIFLSPGVFDRVSINNRPPFKIIGSVDRTDGSPLSIIEPSTSTGRCMTISSTLVDLSNLLLRNGNASTVGGALVFGQSCTFQNCMFLNNNGGGADSAGALHASTGVTCVDCEFRDNQGQSGAGAIFAGSYPLVLERCRFENNHGRDGGAIEGLNALISVTDCSFRNNVASRFGGGVYAVSSFQQEARFLGCTFEGNAAIDYETATGSARFVFEACSFEICCRSDVGGGTFLEGNLYAGNPYWACDSCRADVNCSGNEVDSSDLGQLLAVWHTAEAQCDLDGSGLVDAADIGLMIAQWGPCN